MPRIGSWGRVEMGEVPFDRDGGLVTDIVVEAFESREDGHDTHTVGFTWQHGETGESVLITHHGRTSGTVYRVWVGKHDGTNFRSLVGSYPDLADTTEYTESRERAKEIATSFMREYEDRREDRSRKDREFAGPNQVDMRKIPVNVSIPTDPESSLLDMERAVESIEDDIATLFEECEPFVGEPWDIDVDFEELEVEGFINEDEV